MKMASLTSEKTPEEEMYSTVLQGQTYHVQGHAVQHLSTGSSTTNPPVILYATPPPTTIYQTYKDKRVLRLGIAQVVCGVLSMGLQIAAIVEGAHLAHVGTGIWTGLTVRQYSI